MTARPRWVIAVRVSTEEQEVAQQLDALQAAAVRQGAEVVEVVRIEGESAWDRRTSREVERRMLAPIAEGRAEVLAVWALDRVTRQNIKETLAFFDRLEKHLGGQLFSLTEPIISTATMVPETRDLFIALFAYLANRESSRKSDRVKAKRDAKVNRAAALGVQATWGRGKLATPTQVANVWLLTEADISGHKVAKALGLSKSQVYRILGRPRPALAEAMSGVPMGPPGQGVVVGGGGAPSVGGGLGQSPMPPEVAGVKRLEPVRPVGGQEVAADRKVA